MESVTMNVNTEQWQYITSYYNGKDIILWARKDKQTKQYFTITGFEPYLFILSNAQELNMPQIIRVEHGFKGLKGEALTKLIVKQPTDVKVVRAMFTHTWEADVQFHIRHVIDTKLFAGFRIRGTYTNIERKELSYTQIIPTDYTVQPIYSVLDIEVHSEAGFPSPDNPIHPVVGLTVWDNRFGLYLTMIVNGKTSEWQDRGNRWQVKFCRTENEMYGELEEYYIRLKPDLISGFNSEKFDYAYMLPRMKMMGFDVSILKGAMHFDLMIYHPRVRGKSLGKKLKMIAVEEEIVSKDELVADQYDPAMYTDETRHEEFLKYNWMDVYICVKLIHKYSMNITYWGLKNTTGSPDINDMLLKTRTIDPIALRIAQGQYGSPLNIKLPTSRIIKKQPYKAAINFPPKAGIYNGVGLFDFSKHFPSTIMMFNFSPEYTHLTEEERVRQPLGIAGWLCKVLLYVRAKEDIKLAHILETEGMSKAWKIQKIIRDNAKFLLNSVYGALGFVNSKTGKAYRLYDRIAMEQMVKRAMEGLTIIKEEAEAHGYPVLMGHTDSIMVKCEREEGNHIASILNIKLGEIADSYNVERLWEVKYEAYASKVFFTKAKSRMDDDGARTKYAMEVIEKDGVLLKEPDQIIKGFAMIRNDASKITKTIQQEFFAALFEDKLERFVKKLKKMIRDVKAGKYEYDDIAIAVNLSDNLGNYKNKNAQHVRGSIYASRYFGWKIGKDDRVKMLFVKGIPNYPKTSVICYFNQEELPHLIPDYEQIIDRTIKKKIELLVDAAGHSWKKMHGQTSLEDKWFG